MFLKVIKLSNHNKLVTFLFFNDEEFYTNVSDEAFFQFDWYSTSADTAKCSKVVARTREAHWRGVPKITEDGNKNEVIECTETDGNP